MQKVKPTIDADWGCATVKGIGRKDKVDKELPADVADAISFVTDDSSIDEESVHQPWWDPPSSSPEWLYNDEPPSSSADVENRPGAIAMRGNRTNSLDHESILSTLEAIDVESPTPTTTSSSGQDNDDDVFVLPAAELVKTVSAERIQSAVDWPKRRSRFKCYVCMCWVGLLLLFAVPLTVLHIVWHVREVDPAMLPREFIGRFPLNETRQLTPLDPTPGSFISDMSRLYAARKARFGNPMASPEIVNLMLPPTDDLSLCEFPQSLDNLTQQDLVNRPEMHFNFDVALLVNMDKCSIETSARVAIEIQRRITDRLKMIFLFSENLEDDTFKTLESDNGDDPEELAGMGVLYVGRRAGSWDHYNLLSYVIAVNEGSGNRQRFGQAMHSSRFLVAVTTFADYRFDHAWGFHPIQDAMWWMWHVVITLVFALLLVLCCFWYYLHRNRYQS